MLSICITSNLLHLYLCFSVQRQLKIGLRILHSQVFKKEFTKTHDTPTASPGAEQKCTTPALSLSCFHSYFPSVSSLIVIWIVLISMELYKAAHPWVNLCMESVSLYMQFIMSTLATGN